MRAYLCRFCPIRKAPAGNWLCFFRLRGPAYCRNLLLQKTLCQIGLASNWLCLALFFRRLKMLTIPIMPFHIDTYAHFSCFEIGFVLHFLVQIFRLLTFLTEYKRRNCLICYRFLSSSFLLLILPFYFCLFTYLCILYSVSLVLY